MDLLLCETMSSIEQARGAVLGAQTVGLPVWLAVTVDDDDGTWLRSGQPISLVVELCHAMSLNTIMVNCCISEAVDMAVGALTGCGLRVGAYANGFTRINKAFLEPGATVDVLQKRKDLDPEAYAGFVADWVSRGVGIVGGGCEEGAGPYRVFGQTIQVQWMNRDGPGKLIAIHHVQAGQPDADRK